MLQFMLMQEEIKINNHKDHLLTGFHKKYEQNKENIHPNSVFYELNFMKYCLHF